MKGIKIFRDRLKEDLKNPVFKKSFEREEIFASLAPTVLPVLQSQTDPVATYAPDCTTPKTDFNLGDGVDAIQENAIDPNNDVDTLILGDGLDPAQASVYRVGNDLALSFGGTNGDGVWIMNYFAPGNSKVEQILFADGTAWTETDILARVNDPQNRSGSPGNDTYTVVSSEDGIAELPNGAIR